VIKKLSSHLSSLYVSKIYKVIVFLYVGMPKIRKYVSYCLTLLLIKKMYLLFFVNVVLTVL